MREPFILVLLQAMWKTIYLENFDDRSAGAQSDMDGTNWSSDPGTNSPSFYGVETYNSSKMFGARENWVPQNGVGVVTWTSQEIDISNHSDISVTVDIFEEGELERLKQQMVRSNHT